MKNMDQIRIGTIGNFYGVILIQKREDGYYWGIEDHDIFSWEKISDKMADAMIEWELERREQNQA